MFFCNAFMYDFFYYFSEKKSFTVYTSNNISTYHMFPNKLNFKMNIYESSSSGYIEIFLMGSNPNIMLGDMYYIKLKKEYDRYGHYGHYGHNLIRGCTLMKCTSDHTDRVIVHRELRYGCDSITHNVSTSVNFKLWINLIFLLLEVLCPGKFII